MHDMFKGCTNFNNSINMFYHYEIHKFSHIFTCELNINFEYNVSIYTLLQSIRIQAPLCFLPYIEGSAWYAGSTSYLPSLIKMVDHYFNNDVKMFFSNIIQSYMENKLDIYYIGTRGAKFAMEYPKNLHNIFTNELNTTIEIYMDSILVDTSYNIYTDSTYTIIFNLFLIGVLGYIKDDNTYLSQQT